MKKLLLFLLLPLSLLGATRVDPVVVFTDGRVANYTNLFRANSNALWQVLGTTNGVAKSVSKISDLVSSVDPLSVAEYGVVKVLGYSSAGDGGGGDFRRVLASSGSTNTGTFFASTANQTYAWQRVIGDGQITSAQWGIATWSDDLVAMQSWVDYAAANNLRAVLTDGSYLLTNSLVIPSNLRFYGSYNSVFERAAVSSQTNSHNFSALRTAYTFNPYQTNGGYTGQSVPGLVTNVTLSGFRLKTADNYHSSFGIAAFCAQDWLIQNLTVDTMTNHWAVTIYGNKVKVTGCTINNGGSVYQDGLHVIGGDQIVFTGNLVNAGDDALVLSTPWEVQQDISNVTMSGNVANSTHAHAIRMMIEATDGTNHIRNVVVNGLTGSAGQVRNALVRIESDSTNVLYGVTNVSISNVRLYHGGLAGHGGSPVGSAYGYVIHHADNITFTDCHVGGTPYWNYYIENCGNVTLTDCTGSGAEFTSLNATMYVNGVENLTINGGRYGNANALTADTIWIADAGNVKFHGTWVENSITNRAAVTLFGTAADLLSMVNCTLTNSGGYALTAFTSPAKALVVGNVLDSIQGVVWQAGTPPAGSVVINNVGVTESTVRTGTEYTIQSSGGSYLGGMGSRSSLVRFAATNGTFVFAQDDSGGGTKTARVGGQSSATGTPLAAFVTTDTGTLGTLTLGGSSVLMRSPAVVDIANDVNYGSGTSRVRVSTNGVVIEPAGVSSSADASAALDVRSTTLGLLLPRTTATPTSASDGLLWYRSDTDVFSGQVNGAAVNLVTSTTVRSGTGTPEGVVTAPAGTLFLRTDGGAGSTLYVKESGSGNTGWVAK